MGAIGALGLPQAGFGAAQPPNPLLAARPARVRHIRLGSVRQRHRLVYRAHDRLGGRTSELSGFAAHLLMACDGARTVIQLVPLMRRFRSGASDPDLIREVLTNLSVAETYGLIHPLVPENGGFAPPKKPSPLALALKNPLFARFSLFSPDAIVTRMAPLAHALFNPLAMLVWLSIVCFGVWLAAGNWGDLVTYGQAHAFHAGSLIWMAVLFPLIKIVHEMGHALACKRWGGEVRDFGVMMLVMMPIPFVDCSDSAFFVRRRQRIAVAAAGMMAEFVIATAALCIWLASTHELTRLLALNTMVLTSITTIVFNANPLLRFDAYYIFGELIGIDNLGTKSQKLIQTLSRRFLLGDKKAVVPKASGRQNALFFTYGLASFAYKCVIVFIVVTSVFPQFFVFGLVLAIWGAAVMIVMPVAKQIGAIMTYTKSGGSGSGLRAATRIGAVAALIALILAIPVPYAIVADGAVRLPPESTVRAGASGTVAALPRGRAATVERGEVLAILANDAQDAELAARQASLEAQQRRHGALLVTDIAEAALLRAEIGFLREDIALGMRNRDQLTIAAPLGGNFVLNEDIRGGVFVAEGDELGVILPPDQTRAVLVVLAQEDADLVRTRLDDIAARPLGSRSEPRPATLLRDYPIMMQASGSAERIGTGRFALELEIASGTDLAFGQAMVVRFDLGDAPLAVQLWRAGSIWAEKILMSRHVGQSV